MASTPLGKASLEKEAASPLGKETLEQRLRASFHRGAGMPKAKELHESFAFFKAIAKELPPRREWPLVIDVAGGHGILAALVLIYGRAQRAVVIDPHRPNNADSVLRAWAPFLQQAAASREAQHAGSAPPEEAAHAPGAPAYVQEDLCTALPRLLAAERGRVLVLACHACAHLTEQVVAACAARRPSAADFCVMPCCQRAPRALKQATREMGVDIGAAMDLVLLGMAPSARRRRAPTGLPPALVPHR